LEDTEENGNRNYSSGFVARSFVVRLKAEEAAAL
jgi:hypothetical protein